MAVTVLTACHGGHGGRVGHVGVGSGSEAPARSPKGVEIQHRFGILKSASTQAARRRCGARAATARRRASAPGPAASEPGRPSAGCRGWETRPLKRTRMLARRAAPRVRCAGRPSAGCRGWETRPLKRTRRRSEYLPLSPPQSPSLPAVLRPSHTSANPARRRRAGRRTRLPDPSSHSHAARLNRPLHARLSALRPSSPPPAAQAQALPAPPPHARPPLPSSSLAVSPPPPCPHIRMIRLPKSQEKYLDCVAIDSVLIHFSTRHIAESFAKEQS
jgi:hypothetical protein